MSWYYLILMILASYRLTRLVVKDTFPPALWVRDRLAGGWRPLSQRELDVYTASNMIDQRRLRERWTYDPQADEPERWVNRRTWSPVWLAELITCPWCASAYVSAAVVAVSWVFIGFPAPVLAGFAVWAVASVLASREQL